MSVPMLRPASEADLSRLVEIELEAGRAFRDVEQVSVSPQHPGQRLGRAMIEHVEHWGRAHG